MNRQEKHQSVTSMGQEFRSVSSAFLIDYRGLKVIDATELRRRIREIEGSYIVDRKSVV